MNQDLLIEIYKILPTNDIYNISLMNKKYYNFYTNNINYIGILKLKILGFKKFNKTYDNFNIYNIVFLLNKDFPSALYSIGVIYFLILNNYLEIVKFFLDNNRNTSIEHVIRASILYNKKNMIKYILENDFSNKDYINEIINDYIKCLVIKNDCDISLYLQTRS